MQKFAIDTVRKFKSSYIQIYIKLNNIHTNCTLQQSNTTEMRNSNFK